MSLPLFTIDTVPFFLCLILGLSSISKYWAWSPYNFLTNHKNIQKLHQIITYIML
uniref:Uncharacterized protein n=1 Tax=Octopus bimaculoides TaxID=37653 RepID=A0A0L8I155_OCTBM